MWLKEELGWLQEKKGENEMIWETRWEANLSRWQVPCLGRKLNSKVGILEDPNDGILAYIKWKLYHCDAKR